MTKKLTNFEKAVIEDKGTERPFSGLYVHTDAAGTYSCKKCGAELYRSDSKFHSNCGWPSFDDEIEGAVRRVPDADGRRVEIVCSRCEAHLGHVFEGEGYTQKNIRHCVNSVSLDFKAKEISSEKTAIFASGCFWGTEFYMARIPGVLSTEVGYIGGHVENPSYEDVCSKKSGHIEAVKVTYDSKKVSFRDLAMIFFETHNYSQEDGQGPDIGPQYVSRIFTDNDDEISVFNELSDYLKNEGHVATKILKPSKFWPAEDYHQNYYEKQGSNPYCHIYREIFPRA